MRNKIFTEMIFKIRQVRIDFTIREKADLRKANIMKKFRPKILNSRIKQNMPCLMNTLHVTCNNDDQYAVSNLLTTDFIYLSLQLFSMADFQNCTHRAL